MINLISAEQSIEVFKNVDIKDNIAYTDLIIQLKKYSASSELLDVIKRVIS